MKRRTKIVCTLGPAVNSKAKVKELIDAGMNVARLNCSHGDWETRKTWIEWIRELSSPIAPVGILADLQGPKFRLGEVQGKQRQLQAGQQITVGPSIDATLPVPQPETFAVMSAGDRLLLGDGEVEVKLGALSGTDFTAKVVTGGIVKSHQGLTVMGKAFDVPILSEKDKSDAEQAAKAGVDFIALSYVRKPTDMRELRRLVDQFDSAIHLCAKIETREALKEIDDILKVSDLVMVARGDLGLQMDLEDVPLAQKRIIEKCAIAGKPVITATQMLESMCHAPRPTRAEASDVANAILDGTDAVMLSGETANGEYPIMAAKTMARIAEKAESLFDFEGRLDMLGDHHKASHSSTEAVAESAVRLASLIRAKAMLTTTTSGQTARMVSKFRPTVPICCASWRPKTHTQMSIVFGVESIAIPVPQTTDEVVAVTIDGFLAHKRLKIADTVVVTAGVPPGSPGHTNLILVETVK